MLEKLEKEKEELLASMEQSLANKFERLYKEEKKKRQEAEGENTIIKGIGNNSPEMKELQKRLGSAQDINDEHQRYNGKLQTRLTEVEEDNKNLAKQVQDLTSSRKFGDGTH